MSIVLNPFNPKYKVKIMLDVIAMCNSEGILKGISTNGSHELGFTLPHGRQIRFNEDVMNNTTSMSIKDNGIFSRYELNTIRDCVNRAVSLLSDNEIKALPIPSSHTTIKVLPFYEKHKTDIMDLVIKDCPLKGIQKDSSSEGGFNLPMGDWYKVEVKSKDMLRYHGDRRQLRFWSTDGITVKGMFLKDDINYMTDDELNTIRDCVNRAVTKLYRKY